MESLPIDSRPALTDILELSLLLLALNSDSSAIVSLMGFSSSSDSVAKIYSDLGLMFMNLSAEAVESFGNSCSISFI